MNKIISFFSRMLIATFVFMVNIAMLLVDFILLPFKYLSRMPVGMKVAMILLLSVVCQSVSLYAQDGGGGIDVTAGTSALEQVTTGISSYLPYVVNLCYALAAIFAVVGAISVYIAMNNDEQDVKNILVLQKWRESTRKQMKVKVLCINELCDYFTFPILSKLTLKKI